MMATTKQKPSVCECGEYLLDFPITIVALSISIHFGVFRTESTGQVDLGNWTYHCVGFPRPARAGTRLARNATGDVTSRGSYSLRRLVTLWVALAAAQLPCPSYFGCRPSYIEAKMLLQSSAAIFIREAATGGSSSYTLTSIVKFASFSLRSFRHAHYGFEPTIYFIWHLCII